MAKARAKTAPDMTLGALVAHPLRSECLTLLADRTASPAELAVELNENLGNVSYHVRKLWKGGAVELVEERPVRGAMEHFYRAIRLPMFSDEEIAEASIEDRRVFARQAISMLIANATTALDAKTFVERHNYHVARVPLRVDEDGWKELAAMYEEMLERTFQIQAESAERLGGSDDAGVPVIAFSTFFEMPERPKGA